MMDTQQDFDTGTDQGRIVYVRPVKVAELPDELREQMSQTPAPKNIYSVHAANGDRLALVNGQKLAFVLARQNDMTPVHAH